MGRKATFSNIWWEWKDGASLNIRKTVTEVLAAGTFKRDAEGTRRETGPAKATEWVSD